MQVQNVNYIYPALHEILRIEKEYSKKLKVIIIFHILGTNEMSAEQIQTADLNFDLVITIEDVLKLADIVMGN